MWSQPTLWTSSESAGDTNKWSLATFLWRQETHNRWLNISQDHCRLFQIITHNGYCVSQLVTVVVCDTEHCTYHECVSKMRHTCLVSHTHCLWERESVCTICMLFLTHTLLLSRTLLDTHTHTLTHAFSHTLTHHYCLSLSHTLTPLLTLSSIWLMFSLQWSCNHIQLTCCVLNASQPPIWLNDHSVFVSPALSDDVIVLVVITWQALCTVSVSNSSCVVFIGL